jgi:hypothetical protein
MVDLRVKDDPSNEHGQDETRHQSKDAVGPRETHNGEADVLGEQQCRSLLPTAGTILDSIAIF